MRAARLHTKESTNRKTCTHALQPCKPTTPDPRPLYYKYSDGFCGERCGFAKDRSPEKKCRPPGIRRPRKLPVAPRTGYIVEGYSRWGILAARQWFVDERILAELGAYRIVGPSVDAPNIFLRSTLFRRVILECFFN